MRTETLVTYKMADGSLIGGEFSWTTGTEFFDDCDEPADVVREVWQLVTRESLRLNPPGYMKACEACDTEGVVDGQECSPCLGEGYTEPVRIEALDGVTAL